MRAPALFLALALAWLWPVPARLTSRIAHDLGDPLLNTWILWWNTQAIPFTDRWWNAPFFYPAPATLALSEHLLGIAVFTAPLHLLGLTPIGAYNVALILSAWLSGYFAFLLGRKLTGSALAGVIAGVAFGFCPYRVGQLSHLQVLTAQWMPLALFAMHSYLDDRRWRWLAIFAAAWVLQALSNGYYLLFFPVLIAMWLAWFVDWRRDGRAGLALGATFALSSLLLVPVLLQYRHVHESMGLARQRGEMLLFSAELSSFLHMPYALRFWPDTDLKTQEDLLFPGVTAIALVIVSMVVSIARKRPRPNVEQRAPFAFYVLATVALWWLAFGPVDDGVSKLGWLAKPYSFLTLLPGFSGLRVPARFAMLAWLTLGVAAALAFVRITAHNRRAQGALGAVVLAGLLVDGWPTPVPLHAPPGRVALPDVKDAIVLELPLDDPAVGTAAMYRAIEHRRPLISGYSGHFPPFYRILHSALQREDPGAVLYFTQGRPVIVTVNQRNDPGGWMLKFVRSLPDVIEQGGSVAGSVFVLPARPRSRAAPLGRALTIARVIPEAREHVVLDLGASQIVRAVGFNLRWHFGELAPRVEVEASDDGVTWRSVWLDWTGASAIHGALESPRDVPIRIPLPDVAARYLRVHPAPRWMVPELTVYGPSE